MSVAVRRARVEDAGPACTVLRRSITECCAEDHAGNTVVLDAWLQNKTEDNVREWFASTRAYAVVAEMNGELVGAALLGGNGSVALCYLVPEARFLGAGKAMLRALEVEATRRGQTEVTLSSTRTAHAFYLRNGYQDTGVVESAFGLESPAMRKVLQRDAAT
jgi:GNAT superfamily N-acetyltransferase